MKWAVAVRYYAWRELMLGQSFMHSLGRNETPAVFQFLCLRYFVPVEVTYGVVGSAAYFYSAWK